jgi:ribonuclease HI
MCASLKEAIRERIQVEFTSFMADKYGEHNRIYTFGSLMDDKVGFAVVTNNRTIIKRMRPQSSIYSAEQQAIITALKNITQTSKPMAISTDSLSTLLAASGNSWTRNPKTRIIRKLIDNFGNRISLIWVPSHAGMRRQKTL